MSLRDQIVPGSGLSLSSGLLVLGNDLNDPKAPAQLKSNREIPMNGFNLYLTGTGNLIVGKVTDSGERLQVAGTSRYSDTLYLDSLANLSFMNGRAIYWSPDGTVANAYGYLRGASNVISLETVGATVPLVFVTNGSERSRIVGGGNWLVNTTTDNGQKLQLNGNMTLLHLIGNSVAPGIAAGTGAGTGPTVSITGTDLSLTISITTGTVPAASATVATISYNAAYGAKPRVILKPANAAAAALAGVADIYVDDATSGTAAFVLKSGTTALPASTGPLLYYAQIIQ